MSGVAKILAYRSSSVFQGRSQKKIGSSQAERVDLCARFALSKIQEIRKHINSLDEESRTAVRFAFTLKKITVLSRGSSQTFTVPSHLKTEYLKLLKKTVSFLEYTGSFVKEKQEELQSDVVREVKAAAEPTNVQKATYAFSAGEGGLSVSRQILNLIKGPENKASFVLGSLSAGFWFLGALAELQAGISGAKYSEKIKDSEGKRRSQAQAFSGGVTALGSASLLTEKVVAAKGASEAAAAGLSFATSGFFGLASIFGAGMASLGIYRCYRFTQRLDEVMQTGATEGAKLRNALLFFKEFLSIHPLEKEMIVDQVRDEHPNALEDEKARIIEEKLKALAEVKVKYLKRRTSFKAVEAILNKTDGLIESFNGTAEKKDVEGARELVALVKSENSKKTTLFAWVLLASLLSFVSSLLFLVGVVTLAPYVLAALSTFILAAIILHGLYVKYLKKDGGGAAGAEGVSATPLGAAK